VSFPEPAVGAASAQEQIRERTQTTMRKKRWRQRLKRIEADAGRSTLGREKENRGRTKPAHWAKNNNVEHFRSEPEMKSKGEQQQHTRDEKFGYSIKIQHDYTESEEVTALHPSFDYRN
jgi:hypothetical protein